LKYFIQNFNLECDTENQQCLLIAACHILKKLILFVRVKTFIVKFVVQIISNLSHF